MRVGVTNVVLSNTGDAAIFQAIKDTVENAWAPSPVEVVAFDSAAADTALLYPAWTVVQQLTQVPRAGAARFFRIRQLGLCLMLLGLARVPAAMLALAARRPLRGSWVGAALRQLDACDVVVSTGGTYLVDHYNFLHRYTEIRVARSLGKPVVLWTQSMGPFRSTLSRHLIRGIGQDVAAVFCRDDRSARAWRESAGSTAPVEVVPDAVFAIEPPPPPPRDPTSRTALVSVRQWTRGVETSEFDSAAYEAMMKSGVAELHRRGFSVRAVSTCQGVPGYAYDDAAYAATLFSDAPVSLDDDHHTPHELMTQVAAADLVVTTRMHLAIMALVVGVPVVAVAYEFKTQELFEQLGLAADVIRIEDSDPEWMLEAVVRHSAAPGAQLPPASRAELHRDATRPVEALRGLGIR